MMRKGIVAVLICLICLGVFGCQQPNTQTQVAYRVWSMPSTVKVLQDENTDAYDTTSASVDVQLCKNEYEGTQLIVCPEKNVQSYRLKAANLTNASGDVFSAENIKIYHMYYTEVRTLTSTTSGSELGFYPDGLIPAEVSEKAGENKIEAGKNQGIYIDFYAPKTSEAGLYSGNFTLTVNGFDQTIPVSLLIWDFELSDEVHLQSSFNLFPEPLIGGQLNNTREMYETYVDYLLDFRISTTDMVYTKNITQEDWVKKIQEYAANPKVTSYKIGGTFGTDVELRLLIENSTPQLNLLKKAFFYLYDEPYYMMEVATENYYKAIDNLIAVADEYERNNQLAQYGLVKSDIEGIQVLITLTQSISTIEGLRTYCPLASDLHTEFQRQDYLDAKNNPYLGKNNELAGTDYGTTWWYVCVHPQFPYVNYNMDTKLVDCRVLSWMQYDYNLQGMLYWGTGTYIDTDTIYDATNGFVNVNVYQQANGVFEAANGDGYLLYPGAKYGVDEPFPSLRLMSIRDGFEDYEYLYMLEELSEGYAQQYGYENFTLDAVMQNIYDSLYNGAIAKADYNLVLEARKQVVEMLRLITDDVHALVEVGTMDFATGKLPIEIYAQAGTELTVSGASVEGEVAGEGVKFSFELPLDQPANYLHAELTYGGKTIAIDRFLMGQVVASNAFDEEEAIERFRVLARPEGESNLAVSLNTNATYLKAGEGSMKIALSQTEWTAAEIIQDFKPAILISKTDLLQEYDFADLDAIEVWVYNASEQDVELVVSLLTDARQKDIQTVTLRSGWNTVRIEGIYQLSWQTTTGVNLLESVTDIAFSFNRNTQALELYFDNLMYSLK